MTPLRTFVVSLALATAAPAAAQIVAVPAFQSVESRNGAHVTVRYGSAQSVRVVSGSPQISVSGDRLVIDNHGPFHEPRVQVEVVTPNLDSLSQAQGGRMTVESGFPRMASVALSVAHGGGLDARQLPVDEVTASVSNGGLIAVHPARRLAVAISQGGIVTYWGSPTVSRSIRQGGVVERGRPEEAAGPIWTDPESHQ